MKWYWLWFSHISGGSEWLWPWEWQITAQLVQSQREVHVPRNTSSLAICRKSLGALSFGLCAMHTCTYLVLLSLPPQVMCTSVLSPVWAALTGCLPFYPSPLPLYMLRDPEALTDCCWLQLIYFTVTLFLEYSLLFWSFEKVFRETESTLFLWVSFIHMRFCFHFFGCDGDGAQGLADARLHPQPPHEVFNK